VSYLLIFTLSCLLFAGIWCTFLITNIDSHKSVRISYYYPHYEGVLHGLLFVFMMWQVNLPSTIRIMKVPSSLLSAFMKTIVRLCLHHKCGMHIQNVLSYLLSTFMIEAANSNGLCSKCLRTAKVCKI
jgi:hypothetical protein